MKRQTKTRKFYNPGNGPDGHWVDESMVTSEVTKSVQERNFDLVKVNDLKKKLKKDIQQKIASLNWDMDLQDQEKDHLMMAVSQDTQARVHARVCYSSVHDMVSRVIVEAIDFDEIKSMVEKNLFERKEIGR